MLHCVYINTFFIEYPKLHRSLLRRSGTGRHSTHSKRVIDHYNVMGGIKETDHEWWVPELAKGELQQPLGIKEQWEGIVPWMWGKLALKGFEKEPERCHQPVALKQGRSQGNNNFNLNFFSSSDLPVGSLMDVDKWKAASKHHCS